MANQHQYPARSYRPDPDELADARAQLPDGKDMNGFLRACLRTLRDDPDAIVTLVEPRWPPARPQGRKPKAAAE